MTVNKIAGPVRSSCNSKLAREYSVSEKTGMKKFAPGDSGSDGSIAVSSPLVADIFATSKAADGTRTRFDSASA